MNLSRRLLLALAWMLLATGNAAWADVFELTDGGRVSGTLVERGQDEEYVIRTDNGATVTLDKSQVRKVTPVDDNLLEYNERSRSVPDTVEAHRQLAEWCKEHRLSKLMDHHLERILQLDPGDEQARESLGFQKYQGRWLTRDQIMEARGLRLYDGAYRTRQDIALREQEKQRETAETDWYRNIATWRRWLDNRRAEEALQNIREIRDPYAAPALVKLLDKEDNLQVRQLYLSALGELKHPAAIQKLVDLSLQDPDRETRQQCLDYLLRVHRPVSLTPYVKALKSPDNAVVLRAAEALKRIGDPAAISPLIDALVTTHKYDNPDAAPGDFNASFSPSGGGAGFSFGGGGNKIVKIDVQNAEVRMALMELSRGQDFQYNENAWRRWFVNQQVHDTVDARRDE
jgi:hypothetical protein